MKFTKSALDIVDITICSTKNLLGKKFIILTSKVGEIEYIDRDDLTTITYLGFHFEHKVNKYIQMQGLIQVRFHSSNRYWVPRFWHPISKEKVTHTYTHTHIYIYIYKYIYNIISISFIYIAHYDMIYYIIYTYNI